MRNSYYLSENDPFIEDFSAHLHSYAYVHAEPKKTQKKFSLDFRECASNFWLSKTKNHREA